MIELRHIGKLSAAGLEKGLCVSLGHFCFSAVSAALIKDTASPHKLPAFVNADTYVEDDHQSPINDELSFFLIENRKLFFCPEAQGKRPLSII